MNSQNSSPADSTTVFSQVEHDGFSRSSSIPPKKKRGLILWLACLAALVVLVLAIVLPVYFAVIQKSSPSSTASKDKTSSTPGSDPGSGSNNTASTLATTGGDSSEVTTEDGSTFTYSNSFGGFWVSDPADPYGGGAKPNSWTPALNETWTYGKDRINGCALSLCPFCYKFNNILSV